MKNLICCAAALGVAASTYGQAPAPSGDLVLIGLRTPSLLDPDKSWIDLSFIGYGGADELLRTNAWIAYGLAPGWQLDLRGSFAGNGSDKGAPVESDGFRVPSGENVKFGGSDGELLANYKLPIDVPIVVRGGVAYVATPAQNDLLAGVVSASIGYNLPYGISAYLEPKAVFLRDNSLVGIAVGATYEVAKNIELMGEWTPLVAGSNTINLTTGNWSRVQLFGAGLRFRNVQPGLSIDLGVTNATGFTTGMSMTPSMGNVVGLFIGGEYRF